MGQWAVALRVPREREGREQRERAGLKVARDFPGPQQQAWRGAPGGGSTESLQQRRGKKNFAILICCRLDLAHHELNIELGSGSFCA